MKLTIKDIARLAEVSPGTVSKVINQSGSLSQKTIARVRKVIEDTGYQPTFSAKSLATKKSNLIGLIYAGNIYAEMNHPFFNDVVNSFKNAIGDLGYDIVVFSNKKFSKDQQDYLARCIHFQLDGCLIIAGDRIEDAVMELDKSNVPCVGIDIALQGPNSVYVTTDNRKVSEKVVTHLYMNRIFDVGFIGGPEDSFVSNIRKNSFLDHMNMFGMTVKEDWVQHGDYFEQSGYDAMNQILKASQLPQAVFAVSDMMALGALSALKEKGIRVPDEMKIIGCDDIEACRYSNPALTTVRQDKDKMGRLASNMLHDLINNSARPNSIMVDPTLVIRESCM